MNELEPLDTNSKFINKRFFKFASFEDLHKSKENIYSTILFLIIDLFDSESP